MPYSYVTKRELSRAMAKDKKEDERMIRGEMEHHIKKMHHHAKQAAKAAKKHATHAKKHR